MIQVKVVKEKAKYKKVTILGHAMYDEYGKDIVCSSYDDYIKGIKDKQKAAEERYDNRYAGTYGSLREVPGYGTEWNERCIPSGVVISGGRNARC